MQSPSERYSRFTAEILACSAVCGLADAAAIVFKLFESRDLVEYVPRSIWLWCIALWLAIGVSALVVSAVVPARWRGAIAALTMSGEIWLLIAIRCGRPLAIQADVPRTAIASFILVAWLATAWFMRLPRREDRVSERQRFGVKLAVPAILAIALVVHVTESAPAAASITARRDGARGPNVVLIFIDTLRADTALQMPHLQRFMRRGAVFTNAIAPAPWTLPSHFSAITGDSAAETGVTFAHQQYLADDALPLLLNRRGYETAGVVANFFLNSGSGFDRGFRHYEMKGRGLDLCRAAPFMIVNRYWAAFQHNVCGATADSVIASASRIMERREAPLFLLLNFTDVHDLYYVPSKCRRHAGTTPADEFAVAQAFSEHRTLDPRRLARLRTAYGDAAQCLDATLETLFRRIDAMPGPTITIVTSDHGEQFGEHSLFLHGNSLYPELVHVPLAVVGTGIQPRQIDAPVSLTEIHDYVMSSATEGWHFSRMADMIAGRPFPLKPVTTFLLEQNMTADTHPVGAVFDGRFEMISRRSGVEELYDVTLDPATSHNLARDKQYAADRLRLRQTLVDENVGHLAEKLRRERVRKLRSLGYLN